MIQPSPAYEHPAQIPVARSMEWLARVLPEAGASGKPRVLEIGCGRGALAAALLDVGVDLTAIDRDPEAVAAARERGVPAVEADLLRYDAEPYDVVLFTRSLHHIAELDWAVGCAHDLLVPDGTLAVEEFAFERADTPTSTWFYDTCDRLSRAGFLDLESDEAPADPNHDPLTRWREHHVRHSVHTGAAMRGALWKRFGLPIAEEAGPHLYRWFVDRVRQDTHGARDVAALLDEEREGITSGALHALGMRLLMKRGD
jgi:SAM-dependent methyltransferase